MTKTSPAPIPCRNFTLGSLDNRPIVLVIHSSPTVRQALFVTLDLDAFDVRVGGDVAEAIFRLGSDKPQAVIAELSAEDTAERDLVQRLRSVPATMHTPIILITRVTAAPPLRERSVS